MQIGLYQKIAEERRLPPWFNQADFEKSPGEAREEGSIEEKTRDSRAQFGHRGQIRLERTAR